MLDKLSQQVEPRVRLTPMPRRQVARLLAPRRRWRWPSLLALAFALGAAFGAGMVSGWRMALAERGR